MGVRKVAVTGGIACGKTTVCQIFRNLGAHVVSADQIVHQLLKNDPQVKSEVVDLLGESILVEGEIARDRVADLVFRDEKQLRALESLLFPKVFAAIDRELSFRDGLCVVEIPLLFETGADKNYDATIAVVADDAIARSRNPDFERRARYQLPAKEKASQATFIINNNGTLEELEKQVKKVYNKLQGD